MKKIIYSLFLMSMLFACSGSDQLNYESLNVGFTKDKIDVGENSELLEIPLILSGCRNDEPLSVSVQATTVDNTAKSGIDYELVDKDLKFSTCGTALLKVRIIDNDEISDDVKDFSVKINVQTASVKSTISTVKVFILSDDVKEEDVYSGNYTLSVLDFSDDTEYTSETGAVSISKDSNNKNRYLIHHLLLSNGNQVMSLTDKVDLYFTVDENGFISMPIPQNIGYDDGKATLLGLTESGAASSDAISISFKDNKLTFNVPGIAGVLLKDNGELENLYYAFKNIVLEKVN